MRIPILTQVWVIETDTQIHIQCAALYVRINRYRCEGDVRRRVQKQIVTLIIVQVRKTTACSAEASGSCAFLTLISCQHLTDHPEAAHWAVKTSNVASSAGRNSRSCRIMTQIYTQLPPGFTLSLQYPSVFCRCKRKCKSTDEVNKLQ